MKNLLTLFSIVIFSFSTKAQEQKVEIVPLKMASEEWQIYPSVKLVCSTKGITVLKKSGEFNTYYDVHNYLSKVPSVLITSNSNLNQAPIIRMRGDDNTVVIVDGVRYDTSILNTLNPSNIESIKVATGAAASNYLINN